jgi:putative ABC transport system permease protein
MMVRIILISIVLISVMNIMMMSVFERTSEIGTIAAIGTSPRKILSLFLTEGFFLGFMSTLAGVIIGIVLLLFMKWQTVQFAFGPMDNLVLVPDIPFGEGFGTSVIVVFVSLFASWQPAWKASKLEPVDALGHV